MSTRSLTVFIDDDKEYAVMYRHYDGYLDGHGKELAEYLSGKKMVNGIGGDDDRNKIFNGFGCLVASVVAKFKDGPGNIYLYPPGTRDLWEDYTYIVTCSPSNEPTIKVEDFNDHASAYNTWLEKKLSEDE